jgi:hypothetical protein
MVKLDGQAHSQKFRLLALVGIGVGASLMLFVSQGYHVFAAKPQSFTTRLSRNHLLATDGHGFSWMAMDAVEKHPSLSV